MGHQRARLHREQFLLIQLFGVVCFAVTIPISAGMAEHGRRRMLMWATVAIALFGLVHGAAFVGRHRRAPC